MSLRALLGAAPLWMGVAMGLVAFALRIFALRRSRRDRDTLVEEPLLRLLVRMPPSVQGPLRASLFAVGVGLLAAGAGGAASGGGDRRAVGEPETVLLLDASNSMLAEDVAPSRLERQRELASALAPRLSGPVGVVYFAGAGYVLSPLTTDRGAVLSYVGGVRPASVGRGGSSLAPGLSQALNVLAGGEPGAARSVVLFSDGEETADDPIDAVLTLAVAAGVRVYTVGIGTPEGGTIPLGPEAAVGETQSGEFLLDPEGEVVVTRLAEESLRGIAETTGGVYVEGSPEGLATLFESLGVAESGPGSRSGSPSLPGGGATLLLLFAFGLLWAEGFLFRSA